MLKKMEGFASVLSWFTLAFLCKGMSTSALPLLVFSPDRVALDWLG